MICFILWCALKSLKKADEYAQELYLGGEL